MDFELNVITAGDCVGRLAEIPDAHVDGVFTDPPYGIEFYSNRPRTNEYKERVKSTRGIANDTREAFIELADAVLPELYRVMKDDTSLLWCTNWRMQGLTIDKIEENGFVVKNATIWDKVSKGMGDLKGAFGNAYEIVLFAVKGRPLIIGERVRDVVRIPRISPYERIHSHQKPVDLVVYWMEKAIGSPKKLVLDPFAGSGTTIIASARLGNNCVAFEIDSEEAEKGNRRVRRYMERVGPYAQVPLPLDEPVRW